MAKPKQTRTKRTKKVVEAEGIAHIKATFNNTLITIADMAGNTVTWASAGKAGFKGSKKSTPFAATLAAEQCGPEAVAMGVRRVSVRVQGPGSGREPGCTPLRTGDGTRSESGLPLTVRTRPLPTLRLEAGAAARAGPRRARLEGRQDPGRGRRWGSRRARPRRERRSALGDPEGGAVPSLL